MSRVKGTVISLGGSSIFKNGRYNNEFIDELKFLNKAKNIVVVVGGGIKARTAINKTKTKNNFERDLIAINITKQNAKYVANRLGLKYFELKSISDFSRIPKEKAVLGGFLPGLTTDAIAALIAEKKGYRFVNTTNVDFVYTKDPAKYKDAKPLKRADINEIIKIVLNSDKRMPGTNTVLDLISLFIVRRSCIPTVVCRATEENLKNITSGKKFKGTEIVFYP